MPDDTETPAPQDAAQPAAAPTPEPARQPGATGTLYGTGRRKTSVARVRLVPGKGAILVNRRSCDAYFGREVHRLAVRTPLLVTRSWSPGRAPQVTRLNTWETRSIWAPVGGAKLGASPTANRPASPPPSPLQPCSARLPPPMPIAWRKLRREQLAGASRLTPWLRPSRDPAGRRHAFRRARGTGNRCRSRASRAARRASR